MPHFGGQKSTGVLVVVDALENVHFGQCQQPLAAFDFALVQRPRTQVLNRLPSVGIKSTAFALMVASEATHRRTRGRLVVHM